MSFQYERISTLASNHAICHRTMTLHVTVKVTDTKVSIASAGEILGKVRDSCRQEKSHVAQDRFHATGCASGRAA
jgi:hypothetical protein